MAAPGSPGGGAPYGFLFVAILVHVFDAIIRYGTLPFGIKTTPGSPWVWTIFFLLYAFLWLDARTLPAFTRMGEKQLFLFALIAYLWGPFWSILPAYVPGLKYIAALLMLLAPFWLVVTFFATQEFPRLSMLYTILWIFLVTFSLFPTIREYAEEKGYALPDSLSPGRVLTYSWEKLSEAGTNFWQLFFVKAPKKITEEVERSLAMAKGDYYTGKVDAASQKRLGVYFENFRTAEPVFYLDTPVTAYVTMKAETLDKTLDLTINCTADGNITANRILPQSTFTIFTSEQTDIDCVWDKGVLGKASHTLALRSEFDFTTRAYLKTYMMDRDRLREYRRQNVNPLADVPDKNPIAVYSSGPVRIGMGLGQQPIALGASGETLQPLGITIENAWEGKIVQITGVFFIVPKGLEIANAETVGMAAAECNALPVEEQEGCDDTLVNVYTLAPSELASPIYKNLASKTFRIYLTLKDPVQVLGNTPIAVQNFKTSVQYRYQLERTTLATVREIPV